MTLLFSCLLFSCETKEMKKAEEVRSENRINSNYSSVNRTDLTTQRTIEKVNFEGHTYLIYSGGPHMSGFTHDMNCNCLNK